MKVRPARENMVNSALNLEEVSQHYLQSPTVKEILVMPDPRDGGLVALVVPDLDYFRRTGETDLYGEVGWHLEYYSQPLPPHRRIREFVLTNQKLPQNRRGRIEAEAAALYRQLAGRRNQQRPAALKARLSPIGERVVRLLQRHTAAQLVALDDHLQLDLGLDSLALVELLAVLEQTFGLQIQDGDFLGIFTVNELIRFVEGKQPHEFRESARKRTWREILQDPPTPALLQQIAPNAGVTGRLANLGAALGLRSLFKTVFSLRMFGRERLGPGSFILCPNHGSFLDGFLLFAAVPQALRARLYFLGYNNYFEGPTLSRVARIMHVVPVNSARHLVPAMQASAHILNRGGVLGIFPEGARTLTGDLRPFKKGVATLAQEVGVPLVPVYIHGSFQAWGPNARLPRPYPLQIIFGQKFSAASLAARGQAIQPGVRPYEAIILGLRQEVLNLKAELHSRLSEGGQPPPASRPPHQ